MSSMNTKKKKMQGLVFVLIAVMGMGFGVVTQPSLSTGLIPLIPTVFGSDDDEKEDEDEDEEDEDEDKDKEDEEDDKDESEKERKKAEKEAKKKAAEMKKEAEKRKLEAWKKAQERKKELQEVEDEEEDEDEDEAEDEQEDEEMDDDAEEKEMKGLSALQKKYYKAAEDIIEAEAKIAEEQAEGKDVSLALARLAKAKAILASAEQSLDVEGKEVQKSILEAKKLAHWSKSKDIHSANDASKALSDANKRIQKAETKLTLLGSLGGDTAAFQQILANLKVDYAKATEFIKNNSVLEGIALAESTEREAKKLKSSIESALLALGYDDDDLADDHKSEVAVAVENLLSVADIEDDKLGERVREIARAHAKASEETESKVKSVQDRGGVAEFFLGPKYTDLNSIKDQITQNQVRIQALAQAVSQLEDEDLKKVIEEQIEILTEENTKLQSFVSGKEKERGVFGWIFRLFQ
jgi:hypothetical protein